MLKRIALKRDNSKVLDSFISDVLIQTNENLYSNDSSFIASNGNAWNNFGFLPEAGVKVNLKPKSRTLIDGSDFQRGFDFSFEITSLQFYSMYEIEKFKNELCTINLHPLQIYIKDVYVQVEVDHSFDKEGNNKIIISGKKFVRSIRDVYDGNPWGSLEYPNTPWAFVPAANTLYQAPPLASLVPNTVNVSQPSGVYDFVSGRFESYRTAIQGLTVSGGGLGMELMS